MKKILIAVIFAMFISTSAFAYNYTEAEKKGFYDGLMKGLFDPLPQQLVSQGFTRDSAQRYTATLRSRVNRTELENATWPCISRYSYQEMFTKPKEISNSCIAGWYMNYIKQNQDALSILQRQ